MNFQRDSVFLPALVLLFLTISESTDLVDNQKHNYFLKNFVVDLLDSKFSTCSIIFLKIEGESRPRTNFNTRTQPIQSLYEDEDVFSHIANNVMHDVFLQSLQIDKLASLEQPHLIPPTNISKLENLTDLHQHRDNCIVAVFDISEIHFTSSVGDILYENTRKWTNVIKKDEDCHIFVSNQVKVDSHSESSVQKELLVSSQLAMGIKYKILIQMGNKFPQKLDIDVSTTCFYCDYGKPKSVPVKWGQIHPDPNSQSVHPEFTTLDTLFPDYTTNLRGKLMKVGTPTGTRWLNEIRLENGKWIAKRGLYKIVMDNLMSRYNFSCEFFPSQFNGGTGFMYPNGTWVGSVGNIVHKTADIGHVTGQTWQRNKYAGFTYPVSYEMLTFTTGEPLPYFSWQAIWWPLSRELWIGVGLSFVTANFFLLYLIKSSQQSFGFTQIVLYTFATVLEQDMPSAERLKANRIRVFLCFWLFFTLVTCTAYRSKLVSLLSFPNVEMPPQTFEELAISDYHLALQYLRGAAFALLKTSPNPTYKAIFSRMELESDDVKCFERAIGKRFVCISWKGIADFIFKRNFTDQYGRVPVKQAPVTTCFLAVGIIMEKRSIFLRRFSSMIIHATDTGLLQRWWDEDMNFVYTERRNWERKVNRTGSKYFGDGQDSGTLTNKHFRGSYYLLATGTLFGLMAFVWEKISYRKHLVKMNNPSRRNPRANDQLKMIV